MDAERKLRLLSKAHAAAKTFGQADADDLDAARLIAQAAIDRYGDFDDAGWVHYRTYGIWNDYPAVQSALIAIKMMRAELVPLLAPDRSTHSLAQQEEN